MKIVKKKRLKITKSNNIELKPHQKYVVEFMKTNRSIILYHSTGSGKTITALCSMYQFDENIVIIGPKSSKKAFLSLSEERPS